MATEPFQIKVKCTACGGDGILQNSEGFPSCPTCEGTGKILYGIVDGAEQIDELKTKINEVQADTNKIWAKVKDL